MAKAKPSRAFLEALQQHKKRIGDTSPGGAFPTPAWFKPQSSGPQHAPPAPSQPPAASHGVIGPVPMRQRSFRITPIHMGLAALVMLAAVAIAYMAGSAPNAPTLSAAAEAIRSAPPNSSVLEVQTVRPTSQPVARPHPIPAPPAQQAPSAAAQPAPPPLAPVSTAMQARTVGMNYVVIQGYPAAHEKLAHEAAEALRAGGILCTVERGTITGFRSDWHVVVGTTPFVRASGPEYQEYLRRIEAVSEKFAGSVRWRRFEPMPYRWR